jgi:hypothetical protein
VGVPTPHARIAVVRDPELDAALRRTRAALPAHETASTARHLRSLALRGAALVAPGDDVEERLRGLGTQPGTQRWDTLPAPPEAPGEERAGTVALEWVRGER